MKFLSLHFCLHPPLHFSISLYFSLHFSISLYFSLHFSVSLLLFTGLYPESHGALHNVYFNKTTKERTYKFQEALNITEWFDTGAEPIWVTAKNAGKTVGSIMYVGTTVPIKGVLPDRVIPIAPYFWESYSLQDRVRDAVNWISNDCDVVLLYFNLPDFVLHSHLIKDPEAAEAMAEVDQQIGYLFQLIDEAGLSEEVNVILAGDHGFVDVEPRKFIRLYDYINESDVDFIVADYGPFFQLTPIDGKLESVSLCSLIAFTCYIIYEYSIENQQVI